MAAYRRVYDSRHLQADCKEPESALVIEYGLPLGLPFYSAPLFFTARSVTDHFSLVYAYLYVWSITFKLTE